MAEYESNPLSVVDYIVLALLLILLIGMGIYHGMAKRRPTTTRSFFLADRSVFSLPVALTLLASFISPVTLLGNAAETYVYGAQYVVDLMQRLASMLTIVLLYVPVFYDLDITTSYQYLQLRYGFPMRLLGAVCFLFQTIFYIAIVSYSPALVVNAVTNLNLWVIIVTTGLVCTFYSALGGIKAVIWTDVVLVIVIGGTTILIIISCTVMAGGVKQVWDINNAAGRLDIFTFPLDLTERMTFSSVFLGTYFSNLIIWGVSQTAVQRFLSSRTLKDAKRSLWINLPFSILVTGAATCQGIVLYAFYHTEDDTISPTSYCDETSGGCAGTPPPVYVHQPPNYTLPDQIIMIFVNQQFSNIWGYQGLFISCIFAGALSTVSSGINSMVAVTMEDIWKPLRRWLAKMRNKELEEDDKKDTRLSKILSLIFGLLTIVLAILTSRLGTLVTLVNSIFGIFGGPILAAFTLGMVWPRANSRAVLVGTLTSFILGLWIVIGSYVNADRLEDVIVVYRLSFLWYAMCTILTNITISVILSEIIRFLDPKERNKVVDPKLLCAWVRPKFVRNVSEVETKTDNDKITTEI
ncbi:sodium-coupled monocarboxylate transporter 2-like isoform X1 [Apostichopus japonicus]|uniref:sodium-coupled monocarboxylate transporter 2-like isoform X1 n=1 Tax=Stichopus japonicus TaxID=307972 RepID=UPI003AB1EE72